MQSGRVSAPSQVPKKIKHIILNSRTVFKLSCSDRIARHLRHHNATNACSIQHRLYTWRLLQYAIQQTSKRLQHTHTDTCSKSSKILIPLDGLHYDIAIILLFVQRFKNAWSKLIKYRINVDTRRKSIRRQQINWNQSDAEMLLTLRINNVLQCSTHIAHSIFTNILASSWRR